MRIIMPASIALLTLSIFCRTGLCDEPVLSKYIAHNVILHVKTPATPIGVEITTDNSIPASMTDKAKLATVTVYNGGNGDAEIRHARTAFRFPETDYQFHLSRTQMISLTGMKDKGHILTVTLPYDGVQDEIIDEESKLYWFVTNQPQNAYTFALTGFGNTVPDIYQLTIDAAAWTE